MSVPWWASKALLSLLAEVNTVWPDRDKTADGLIGDAAHQAEQSDHNPLPDGEVCALDITTNGIDAPWLAQHLADLAATDHRVKYVIFNRRIFNRAVSPNWRPYDGVSPHIDHIHLSVYPNSAAAPSWGVAEGADVALSDADKAWIHSENEFVIEHTRNDMLAMVKAIKAEVDAIKAKVGA